MNRQTVVYFACPASELAATTMERSGGFEIISVSHFLVGDMATVVLVLVGDGEKMKKHEAQLRTDIGIRTS